MFFENSLLSALFIIFALTAAIQLFYYLWFYAILLKKESEGVKGEETIPVSVIICARNEAENLREFLPSVLEQDYPDYEVIVVNDCSEDDSYDILGKYLQIYPHLKVSNVNKDPKFTHNKKFAQFIGIKAAKNEFLLFTDADCKPVTSRWISGMASRFESGAGIVLGYGGYFTKKGMLNRYIRYDTLFIAMQYLGMALRGFPYMGVGRNLAYRRSLFFDNKGFGSHSHIISGDDDLFVNMNSSKTKTSVEYGCYSHTRSHPSPTLKEWIAQKKRHFTTAPFYKLRDKFLLLTEPVTRILFYALFIVLISMKFLWIPLLVIITIRLMVQITILTLVSRKLCEKGVIPLSLIFDIFSPFINGFILLSNSIGRPGKNIWK